MVSSFYSMDNFLDKLNKIVPKRWQWILNHEGFRRYFKNTGWMFFGQMTSLIISFFIGVWLARYLGPENYGVISYVVAFAGLFSFIASLGVDGILNRELVAHPEQRDELMGTAFRLKLLGGLLAFIVTVIAAFIFEPSWLVRSLIILYSLVFITQAINVISIFFHAKVLSKNNVLSVLTATMISSVLKVLLIISGKGIIWLALIYFLDSVWQGLGYFWAYHRYNLKIKTWRFDKQLAKKIIGSSWFLMLSSASVYIYMKIDQVMVGHFMGEKAVGLYAAAVRLVEVWYFIPVMICSSVFPAIVNAKNTSYLVYKKRLKALYLLMIVIALIISMPLTILAPWLITILFGTEFSASTKILQIYVWSSMGFFLGWAINQYLLSENKTKTIMFYNLLSMVLNVILNLILIPRLGLVGAAWSTLISYSVGPVIILVFGKKICLN